MGRGDFPSAKQDQFVVRLPDGMRDRIKAAADANHRSMNAEIVDALHKAFPGNPFVGLDAMITALERYRQGEDIVVNGQKYLPMIDNGAIKLLLLEDVELPKDFEYFEYDEDDGDGD